MQKTIFLIEDEKSLVETLTEFLRKKGYIVEVAYNGEEAFKMMSVVRPHLILLDIVLPEVDGLNFLKKIQKKQSEFADIPVVVLTNLPDGIETFRTMGLKIEGYFVKANTSLEELNREIKKVLKL